MFLSKENMAIGGVFLIKGPFLTTTVVIGMSEIYPICLARRPISWAVLGHTRVLSAGF